MGKIAQPIVKDKRQSTMSEIWSIGRTARELQLSPGGVRWLIRQGKLNCTQTADGLRLFDADTVKELARKRAEAKSQPMQAA